VATAIWSAAIMLLYGAILVIFSRRNEVAAILRDDGRDERRAAIQLRATAVMGLVVTVFALTMAFVELARGTARGTGAPSAWSAAAPS
jgi:Na+-driven multidrug efflux pump